MIKRQIIFWSLLFCLVPLLVGGDFFVMSGDEKNKVGSFENRKEFIDLLVTHMADPREVEREKKGIYGLMFFILPAPKSSTERKLEKRIADFFKFPGRYHFVKTPQARLYPDKKTLLKSPELKEKTQEHGFYEVFIIGVDVKYHRMHSISKPNGQRIHLDYWYK